MDHHSEIIKRLDLQDDQMFRLGDVIDVKASIALIVITFLATQTADFLKDGAGAIHYLQLVAAISLAIAGVLAMLELWPRDYEIEPLQELDGWRGELETYYAQEPNASELVEREFQKGRITRAEDRIQKNKALNELKSRFLITSFWFTGIALALNLVTLIARAAA